MNRKELILRCDCGEEVIIFEQLDEDFDNEYFVSFKQSPRSVGFWDKIKMCWRLLKGVPNYELVLSKEKITILTNWLNSKENNL